MDVTVTDPTPYPIILELYIFKSLEKKIKAGISAHREELLEKRENTPGTESDGELAVNFVQVKGRRKFSPELAEEFLQSRLSREDLRRFTEYVLTPRSDNPPGEELLTAISDHFNVSKRIVVDEASLISVPGVTDEDVVEHCYETGKSYMRMNTPTKISDRELLGMARARSLSVIDRLLLDEPGEDSGPI